MKTRLVIFTLISLSILGCHREEIKHSLYYEGTIYDKYTHYPLAGATLSIIERWHFRAGGMENTTQHGNWETDSQGKFAFYEEGMHDNASRGMLISHDALGVTEIAVEGEDRNVVDVPVLTQCEIEYQFINTSPFNSSDQVFDIYIERPWGIQEVGVGNPVLIGTNVNATLASSYYGYSQTVLHYSVTKNGVTQVLTDTLNVADAFSCATVNDTISY